MSLCNDCNLHRSARLSLTPLETPNGRRFREETVRRPAFPADPAAIGAIADPDRRGARDLAELHQPDRAQSAPGDSADPAAARGDLRPRSARSRDRRRGSLLRRAERDLFRSAVPPDRRAQAGAARPCRALPRRHPCAAAALRGLYRGAPGRDAGRGADGRPRRRYAL